MMNMKKTLALLLAVVMVIGMIPFGAMAEEAATHIDTCQEGCALEDCACPCHAAPETPAEEPKQEQPKQDEPPVTPASLDDTKTEETPVCTCTPAEDGTHAEGCLLCVKPEAPVGEPKVEETPTCTCTPAEDGTHAEGCALYVKPEAPVCTCTPAEDGTHAEGCALYVKPEAPVCTCTPAEDGTHAEGCALYVKPEAPVCTCTPVEGVHAEGCALYVKPEAPVEEPKTEVKIVHIEGCNDECVLEDCACECHAETLFERLMATESLDEMNAIFAEAQESECMALTEEEFAQINAHADVLEKSFILPEVVPNDGDPIVESEIAVVTVNYTKVAPLVGDEK